MGGKSPSQRCRLQPPRNGRGPRSRADGQADPPGGPLVPLPTATARSAPLIHAFLGNSRCSPHAPQDPRLRGGGRRRAVPQPAPAPLPPAAVSRPRASPGRGGISEANPPLPLTVVGFPHRPPHAGTIKPPHRGYSPLRTVSSPPARCPHAAGGGPDGSARPSALTLIFLGDVYIRVGSAGGPAAVTALPAGSRAAAARPAPAPLPPPVTSGPRAARPLAERERGRFKRSRANGAGAWGVRACGGGRAGGPRGGTCRLFPLRGDRAHLGLTAGACPEGTFFFFFFKHLIFIDYLVLVGFWKKTPPRS